MTHEVSNKLDTFPPFTKLSYIDNLFYTSKQLRGLRSITALALGTQILANAQMTRICFSSSKNTALIHLFNLSVNITSVKLCCDIYNNTHQLSSFSICHNHPHLIQTFLPKLSIGWGTLYTGVDPLTLPQQYFSPHLSCLNRAVVYDNHKNNETFI